VSPALRAIIDRAFPGNRTGAPATRPEAVRRLVEIGLKAKA
jgi:hypothetical protein